MVIQKNKKYDVVGIGNAIVDLIAEVDDAYLEKNEITKGVMSLVDYDIANKIGNEVNVVKTRHRRRRCRWQCCHHAVYTARHGPRCRSSGHGSCHHRRWRCRVHHRCHHRRTCVLRLQPILELRVRLRHRTWLQPHRPLPRLPPPTLTFLHRSSEIVTQSVHKRGRG